MSFLQENDPEVYRIIEAEKKRQEEGLELIASENYVSKSILECQGSIFTNKYACGYPKHRYYCGCEDVDEIEKLAIERAKILFGAEHANVQPHSGTQANMSVYHAMCNVGDTIMGMNLADGGHFTHGFSLNFSGKTYHFVSYSVDKKTHMIDYEEVKELARTHNPKLIIAGASSYSREIDFSKFKEIADEVGAYLMVDIAHIAGLVATGLHNNPIPYADFVTSTTHKTLRGARGGIILCKAKYKDQIDSAVFPGIQSGPLMHVIAAKATAFKEAMTPEFKEYQQQIVNNAKTLADEIKKQGLNIVTGGTDNHMMIVDVTPVGTTGKDAAEILEKVNITVNKNTIPYDKLSPFIASGIRIGTPALTTRGMKENEMRQIGWLIVETLKNKDNEQKLSEIKNEVMELCRKFPLHQ